jgi:flagellar basal-body rod protein FlgF
VHRGIYIAASGMNATQMRQDVLSNNLANINNAGYKRLINVQHAYESRPFARINDQYQWTPKGYVDPKPAIGSVGAGSGDVRTAIDFTPGGMMMTGNSTDLAIKGKGFFVLAGPQGDILTRNGSFSLDGEGRLVSQQGYPVLGKQGVILIDDPNFRIDTGGRIYQEGLLEGDYVLVVNAAEETLEPLGSNNYLAQAGTAREADAGSYSVRQENLEKSNVNAMREMMEMLSVLRSYEANQRVVGYQDELAGKVVNDLAAVR